MTPEDYAKIFHEIKNYITCISSSLQLIEKTHPEVTDYPYWKDTISDVWALKKMVIEISSARLCSKLNTEMISLNSFFILHFVDLRIFYAVSKPNQTCRNYLLIPTV